MRISISEAAACSCYPFVFVSFIKRRIAMYRSRKHRIIAGVCGGIAERYNMSPTTVRLLALLSCLLPGPQFIIYIVMWILVPKAPERI
jgi:phage shock protein C